MSFILNPYVYGDELFKILVLTNSTDSMRPRPESKIIADTNNMYFVCTDEATKSFLIKSNFDFSVIIEKELDLSGTTKRSMETANWAKSDKSEIIVGGYENTNSGGGYPAGDNVKELTRIKAATLNAVTTYPTGHDPAVRTSGTYNNSVIYNQLLNSSDDLVMVGSGFVENNNYSRHNSSFVEQSYKFIDKPYLIFGSDIINDILYVAGQNYITRIDTSTDTIDAAYDFVNGAITFYLRRVIYGSDGAVYVAGYYISGASAAKGWIAKLSSDLTTKTWEKDFNITASNSDTRFFGICEHQGKLYVTGKYTDLSSNTYGFVARVNMSTGNFEQCIGITEVTNSYIFNNIIESINNNLYIGGYSRPYNAARNDPTVIGLFNQTDLTWLNGKSTSGNEYSFATEAFTQSAPGSTYAVSGATIANPSTGTSTKQGKDLGNSGTLTDTVFSE